MKDLRILFLKYLTEDSETQDARRKDFNQAIFNAKEGWAVFNDTDLDMVMEKFDKAIKDNMNKEIAVKGYLDDGLHSTLTDNLEVKDE